MRPKVKSSNLIYIYGSTAVGKTYLLKAIVHLLATIKPKSKTLYVTAEEMVKELVSSIQQHRIRNFRKSYQGLDVLLIDDINFLMGKWSTQEEFFYIFDNLFKAGKYIVISADRPYGEIFGRGSTLSRKIQQGMITKLERPNYKNRLTYLKERAKKIGLKVPSDSFEAIAHRFQSNFRELESALLKIKFYLSIGVFSSDIDLINKILA